MVDPYTPYNFVIYPFTNGSTNIDYKTDGSAPTADVISKDYLVISEENFNDTTSTWLWTPYNVSGDQEWEWSSIYGLPPGCAVMNGYDGGANPNEDWLISPSYDFVMYDELGLTFDHARNFATNDGLSVLVSNDYDGTSDPSLNGTWHDLTSMLTFPEQGSWNFYSAGNADFSMYGGVDTYLAFRYISTDSDAATWEVDNALIYGVLHVGISEVKEADIQVYPNPATDIINISSNDDGKVKIINLAGQSLMEIETRKGINQLHIQHLNQGLYMIQFTNNAGAVSTQKIMIR